MSRYTFIDPSVSYPLPPEFDWYEYIETEHELWALFPETEGRRVNFVQIGLTAQIYAGSPDDGSELASNETYLLMPCADLSMRPVRMVACRRLTLSEYRMGHLTAVKLIGQTSAFSDTLQDVGAEILGAEVLDEIEARTGPGWSDAA